MSNPLFNIKNPKNKQFLAIVLVLTMSLSMIMVALPAAEAKTPIKLAPYFFPIIGENSPTMISWMPSPNPLFDPEYGDQAMVWDNATVTFTRPDGTTDVVNGPFKARFPVDGAATRRDIVLVYTPDMQGTWTVDFTWPGDDKYEAVSQVNTFPVVEHHPKRESFAMLSLRPYPAIGLGQELLVNAWVTPPPMTARDTYEDLTFTVRKPDGTVAYTWSQESETPGVTWFSYYFDELGNWTITFSWPGDFLNEPCTITRSIMVQEDPIPYPVADTPLPTESWTFPINVYNREWRNIAGPWYQQYYNASRGSMNPYTEAPKTAHILWKADPASGIGGYVGSSDQHSGITTDGVYRSSPLNIRTVMVGRGYYTAGGMINCVNMSTGEQLWSVPGSFNTGAIRSRAPVLYQFGPRFVVYDAITGAVTLNVTGLPMTLFDDPYVLTLSGQSLVKWTTAGSTNDVASRVIWNASLAEYYNKYNLNMNWWYVIHEDIFAMRLCKYLAGLAGGTEPYESVIVHKIIAYNMTTGEQIYDVDVADPSDPDTWWLQQGPCTGATDGLFYFTITGHPDHVDPPNTAGGYIAFDIATGELEWLSEPFDYPWGNFFAYMPMSSGYGYIFCLTYDGIYALNVTTGKIEWHYSTGNSGMETPYNSWPFGSTGPVVGGGIIFAPNTEHSPTLYYRGTKMHAVDAYTGEKVWDIMGYYVPTALAYGTLLASETPTGMTYAFAKGETATTIEVQNDVYAKGSSMLIKGTVTDQSPAQKGTAAVSDESMTAWMEYLHMQQPKPTDATGVAVKLIAIDQAGEQIDIGTTTSGADGLYKMMWTPAEEGAYTIVAIFEGSESYYGSQASTAVGVGSAVSTTDPAVSPTPTQSSSPTESVTPTQSPTTSSPTPLPEPQATAVTELYIAIAAAIVIAVVVAAAILLKRRTK